MWEKYEQIRNLKGFRDADVARGASIPKATFSNWKRGIYSPKLEKLQRIAAFLGCSVADLTGENDSEQANRPLIDDEIVMIWNSLNEEGQADLLKYARLLSSSNQYIKTNQPQLVEVTA